MYNIIIIGTGTAGMAAAVAAAKEKLKVLVISQHLAEPKEASLFTFFSPQKLMQEFNGLIQAGTAELLSGTQVIALEKNVVSFAVQIKNGSWYYAKAVLIATGFSIETHSANTNFEKNARKDFEGRIIVDIHQASSVPGLYAAGNAALGINNHLLLGAAQGVRAVAAIQVQKNND